MTTPYVALPDHCFHSRVVRGRHPSRFDPITSTRFALNRETRIMTMGSCFAQHLTRWLVDNQFNVLIEERDKQAGGLFSANYGNVYTVAQALQLQRRALGHWQADDHVYDDSSGRFYDPLRPSAQKNGFDTAEELLNDRRAHEACVKNLLKEAEVLVFTLGLTEAWIRNSDGAVLPIAPGVVAGKYDEAAYRFVNFSYAEVLGGLKQFLDALAVVNPTCKVLLTVSPVPLAATYEAKHVSVASMASKAVLRAVVEAVLNDYANVDYFPSFEIFFTPGIGGGYFDFDSRHVSPLGVAHAMRLFSVHYAGLADQNKDAVSVTHFAERVRADYMHVNCDEGKIG